MVRLHVKLQVGASLPHLPRPPFSPSYGFSSPSSVFTPAHPRRSRHSLPRRRPPARPVPAEGPHLSHSLSGEPEGPAPIRRTARLLPPLLPRPAAIRAVDPRVRSKTQAPVRQSARAEGQGRRRDEGRVGDPRRGDHPFAALPLAGQGYIVSPMGLVLLQDRVGLGYENEC